MVYEINKNFFFYDSVVKLVKTADCNSATGGSNPSTIFREQTLHRMGGKIGKLMSSLGGKALNHKQETMEGHVHHL